MKNLKLSLTTVFLLLAFVGTAQWNYNGSHIYNSNAGNVGVGTDDPGVPLDVLLETTGTGVRISSELEVGSARMFLDYTGSGGFYAMDDADVLNLMLRSKGHSFFNGGYLGIGTSTPSNLLEVAKNMTSPQIIIHNQGGAGGAGFTMIDDLYNGAWKFKSAFGGGFKIRDNTSSLDVFVIEQNAMANAIYVKAGGNIGIGTNNPTSKLAVNGKIDCKEVEIYITGWSDFVFDETYELKPLDELEEYIKEKKHLPGVPTEKEALENGISVGKMNAVLLEKIEELTLYVIDLKKENEEMKKEISNLKVK